MTDLPLNPRTQQLIDSYLDKPFQATLITSSSQETCNLVAQEIVKELDTANHQIRISQGDETISIDDIRMLRTQTRGVHSETARLFVLIENAHKMTIEAQNALLKLLEEPGSSVYFVLSTAQHKKLLPTINSRLNTISLYDTADSDAISFLNKQYPDAESTKLYQATGGNLGLSIQLLEDNQVDQYLASMGEVKDFVAANQFERLIMIKDLKTADLATSFISKLEVVINLLVNKATKQDNRAETSKWVESLELLETCRQQIKANTNLKAVLSQLAIKL